jgi:tetratricopeptide (TPR) repeat protein
MIEEQRFQAYLNLVDRLLRCSCDQESQILSANPDLVDAGLMQMLEQMSEVMAQKGDQNTADCLSYFACLVADALSLSSSSTLSSSPRPNPKHQLFFLMQVLKLTGSYQNPGIVYSLLQPNLNLLDDNFAQVLRNWAFATLMSVTQEQAQEVAVAIGNFSNGIREFPLGNRASNVEIAIMGYSIVATVFTCEAFPQNWALTQNYLGEAYQDRIRGEKAENLEVAINYFSIALGIYTRQAFPQEWALLQSNLGSAYSDRIWGERAENLEVAIGYLLAALEVCTRETSPDLWARTQINLGRAYYVRIVGERAENQQQAIIHYENALQVYILATFPYQWASVQNNLGNAYIYRIWGERSQNLERAIAHCKNALLVVRHKDYDRLIQGYRTHLTSCRC